MKKFWIACIGVYIFVWGLICGFLGATVLFVPEKYQRGAETSSAVLFIVIGLCLLITGVSLILKKNWARWVTVGVSGIALLMGIITLAVLLMAPTPDLAKMPAPARLIMGVVAGVFFTLLPGACIFFLARGKTGELFPKGVSRFPDVPGGIKFLAGFYYFGLVMTSISLFFMPGYLNIGNWILQPVAGKLYLLTNSLVWALIATGLLKRRYWAWKAYMVYGIFGALMSVFACTATKDTLAKLYALTNPSQHMEPNLPIVYVSVAIGLVFQVVLMTYVYKKKAVFR